MNAQSAQQSIVRAKPRMHFQRFEFKYFIPDHLIGELRAFLLRFMRWDSYVAEFPSKSYSVISLYYDSPQLDYYYEKVDGMSRRKKVRWRTYQAERADQIYFCEIKRKFDMVTLKDRIIVGSGALFPTMSGLPKDLSGVGESDRRFLEEVFFEKLIHRLQPQVLVRYQRKPLVGIYEDRLRITFDSDIWAARVTEEVMTSDTYEPVLTNGAILEVKFNNSLPFWFLMAVRRYGLSRIAFSKYGRSIERTRGITSFDPRDLLPIR